MGDAQPTRILRRSGRRQKRKAATPAPGGTALTLHPQRTTRALQKQRRPGGVRHPDADFNSLDSQFPHLTGAFSDEPTIRHRRRPTAVAALKRGPEPRFDDEQHMRQRVSRRASYRRIRYGTGKLSRSQLSEIARRRALKVWHRRQSQRTRKSAIIELRRWERPPVTPRP